MELSNEFVWLLEDSPKFIAGRINAATRRYLEELLPPLANAMVRRDDKNVEEHGLTESERKGGKVLPMYPPTLPPSTRRPSPS